MLPERKLPKHWMNCASVWRNLQNQKNQMSEINNGTRRWPRHLGEFHASEVGFAPHVRGESHCVELHHFQRNVLVDVFIAANTWWRVARETELARNSRKLVEILKKGSESWEKCASHAAPTSRKHQLYATKRLIGLLPNLPDIDIQPIQKLGLQMAQGQHSEASGTGRSWANLHHADLVYHENVHLVPFGIIFLVEHQPESLGSPWHAAPGKGVKSDAVDAYG
jgi:hypothetical protein